MQLVIGNKNYSSWSLRAWLHLRESGAAFEEIPIPLYRPDSARRSPSVRDWVAAAEREPETLDFIDRRSPAGLTPLSFG